MSALHNLFFFILALGVLITFHEFGHFWVARRLGVKVLRFSIGFGAPLWRYRKSPEDTEFVVGALPLGGYVKMVDEREGEVAAADLPYAFNRQPLLVRAAIVAAGPLFNLLLAVLLYWIVGVGGETGLKPIVGQVEPNSLAAQAGFQKGDEIVAIGGEEAPTWTQVITLLFAEVVERQTIPVEVLTPAGDRRVLILEIPKELAENPNLLGQKLGLKPFEPPLPPVLAQVEPGSPAKASGLRPGDRIVAVDDVPIEDWRQLVEIVRKRPKQPLKLKVERQNQILTLTLTPEETPNHEGRIGAGVKVAPELYAPYRVTYRLGPVEALVAAVGKTFEFSWLTLKMLGKMLIGEASVQNLSGPISIAQYAGQSAALGISYFLKFLAVVSISLGVVNLLPIPVLDGGHLTFYLVEAVRGKPLSEQAMARFQQIGMAILIALMALAMFLDIQRLFE
ncbi:sigma E protease regulator RseP [Methylothermus subterraneus]